MLLEYCFSPQLYQHCDHWLDKLSHKHFRFEKLFHIFVIKLLRRFLRSFLNPRNFYKGERIFKVFGKVKVQQMAIVVRSVIRSLRHSLYFIGNSQAVLRSLGHISMQFCAVALLVCFRALLGSLGQLRALFYGQFCKCSTYGTLGLF